MMPVSMASMKTNWLKSLPKMSTVKVFAAQDSQLAICPPGPMNMTDNTNPYLAHMDQKERKGSNTSRQPATNKQTNQKSQATSNNAHIHPQKRKRSNNPDLPYLQDLPAAISLT